MTNRTYRVLLAGAILATLLFAVACPVGKSISEINRDPMRYSNREVAIRGTVVNSWGALGTGMFEVDDGTGKMWVVSSSYGVPSKGMRVGVAGTIMPTFSLGGRSFMSVMRETHRRHDSGS
ncbi:MAG TPA: hypothetical protein VMT82_09460 [candidate division Zixibacteria bacterium]|nr:hypothetical protein [candidate division Zixibacteria bacterium]